MSDRKLREADTSKTHQNIVDTADALIAKKGLKGMSVSAVARELGMSHANVYRHFSSRDALLKAVAEGWMNEMRAACEAAVHTGVTKEDKLTALVLTIREQLERRAANPAALDLYDFAQREMTDKALSHHAHRAKLVSDVVGVDVNVTAVLDALRGFTDPYILIATKPSATPKRIRELCVLLCK